MQFNRLEAALTQWALARHERFEALLRAKTEMFETAVGVMLIGGLGIVGTMLPRSF